MDDHTEKIRRRYDRVSAIYDIFESPMELMALKKWRLEVMKELSGKVLEVGVGTGKNIEYYPEGLDITAIDFSEKMLAKAKDKAERLGKKVNLRHMDVQKLEFPDQTFDTIFTTCVFCSVPDPIKGLKEMGRVCKPNGKIIMIEHVRSESAVLGLVMDLFNPLVVNLYGANINRRTVENVYKAGFTKVEVSNLSSDIVKKIQILF
ncbi:ubiquinone/menaquinone biosynthesis C-methylase UbiE [Anaerosolibacter carboniphilus]|uniref:Ubiquinone/menaquinone biosynthesis C-methylase UbiE n=1 Tax=Anaerosolibacter carboniphilus TaxID=1417629 RepID=A0A841KZ70_9FIRM|nr:class I SAM-dependent methyltransferase [Anaerosolibacter carboniphilus]MBB6217270.1 ubiquinone/menaquinone biosynthesis C-methylase UbiE [Anaerosolibacter carboniphilus]